MTENGGASRDGATEATCGQPRRSAKREVPCSLGSGGRGVGGGGRRLSNAQRGQSRPVFVALALAWGTSNLRQKKP
jgi:hypothetical protein